MNDYFKDILVSCKAPIVDIKEKYSYHYVKFNFSEFDFLNYTTLQGDILDFKPSDNIREIFCIFDGKSIELLYFGRSYLDEDLYFINYRKTIRGLKIDDILDEW